MFVTGGLQNPQNAKEFGGHDLVRTIHRYSRFLALLGEKWGCVLFMGAYSTWGKTVYRIYIKTSQKVVYRIYVKTSQKVVYRIYCKTAKDSWRFNFVVFVVSYDPRN